MASFPKVATDFDEIIQADRQRRRNAELAKEIFGRGKQKDKKKDDKRPGRTSTPNLASRVGIAKRSSSTSSNNSSPKFPPKSRNSLPAQNARTNRIANIISNDTDTDVTPSQPKGLSTNILSNSGISIKGASGPFVLHASNFAPGTTAADIEAAIHPDTIFNNGVSSLVSCKVISTRPDVVAELVFTEKVIAESIIAKYNGQKADGRILHVELVRSGVGSMSKNYQQKPRQERKDRQQKAQSPPSEPEVDLVPEIEIIETNAMEDVDMEAEPATNFEDEREAADRDRRDRDSRKERNDHYENKRRGVDRRRDDRDRDHDRDRDREQDRNRDREYERRDERPREDMRNTRASHYGNGVGIGPRGGFGGYGGGPGAPGARGGPGGYRGGGRFGDGYSGRGGGYRGGFRGY